jgi:hypothetical protein
MNSDLLMQKKAKEIEFFPLFLRSLKENSLTDE